jgi:hypothetical protein
VRQPPSRSRSRPASAQDVRDRPRQDRGRARDVEAEGSARRRPRGPGRRDRHRLHVGGAGRRVAGQLGREQRLDLGGEALHVLALVGAEDGREGRPARRGEGEGSDDLEQAGALPAVRVDALRERQVRRDGVVLVLHPQQHGRSDGVEQLVHVVEREPERADRDVGAGSDPGARRAHVALLDQGHVRRHDRLAGPLAAREPAVALDRRRRVHGGRGCQIARRAGGPCRRGARRAGGRHKVSPRTARTTYTRRA